MTWQPIATAPKDLELFVDDMIEIACFRNGALVWLTAAIWQTALYGYVHCATRSGWWTPYFPDTANGADRPRRTGEWIIPAKGLEPTHWRKISTEGVHIHAQK